jgi:hypothetical protein
MLDSLGGEHVVFEGDVSFEGFVGFDPRTCIQSEAPCASPGSDRTYHDSFLDQQNA